jgi:hypothetical protein
MRKPGYIREIGATVNPVRANPFSETFQSREGCDPETPAKSEQNFHKGSVRCRECNEKLHVLGASSHRDLAAHPCADLFARKLPAREEHDILLQNNEDRALVGKGDGWVEKISPEGEKDMGGRHVHA